MSDTREYVGCKSIEIENYDGNGNNLYNMWLTDQEIVRCKDCKHYREVSMSDGSKGHRCSGVFAFVECSPNGFCSWGERNA